MIIDIQKQSQCASNTQKHAKMHLHIQMLRYETRLYRKRETSISATIV
jgi:hypothetical protein